MCTEYPTSDKVESNRNKSRDDVESNRNKVT